MRASSAIQTGNICEPTSDAVRFLDLRVDAHDRFQYLAAIDEILASGQFLNHPAVEQFEAECQALCKSKYAVGVGSGTAALYLALRRLQIGPGHEVILPALGFVGTANAVMATGAKPVFVDVRRDMLIDPFSVEEAWTDRTRAVMPVHFAGNVCDMTALQTLLLKRSIEIVEDAAPAFGATYNGQPAGSFGRIGCFSMNPMKVLGGIGEAGLIIGNHLPDAFCLRDLRYHGMRGRDVCVDYSLNFRLDAVQAVVLLLRLKSAEYQRKRREHVANMYNAGLTGVVGLELPSVAENVRSAWYSYTIQCDEPRELQKHLAEQGIETRIYHWVLVPEQIPHVTNGNWPVAKHVAGRMLSLPIHHRIISTAFVIDSVRSFFHG